MASRYEVEVTLTTAKDLKNVNWRHDKLKSYAVVWVDPNSKCSTRADDDGDTCPYWDQTLVIPLNGSIEDSTLYVDIVHADLTEGTKSLIGSAWLPLRDILDEIDFRECAQCRLELKCPSDRPQGKIEAKVAVCDPRCRASEPYYAHPYGIPPHFALRDYPALLTYGNPYAPPLGPYQRAPLVGYNYGALQYGQGGGY